MIHWDPTNNVGGSADVIVVWMRQHQSVKMPHSFFLRETAQSYPPHSSR